MFLMISCPHCQSPTPYDAVIKPSNCVNCQQPPKLPTLASTNEKLLQQLELVFNNHDFVQAEGLAYLYLAYDPTNFRVYTFKAASALFKRAVISEF